MATGFGRHRGGVATKGPNPQPSAATPRPKGYRLGQRPAGRLAIGDAQYLWLLVGLELLALIALRNKFRRSHGG